MNASAPDRLLIAVGNSARGDDGLGWAFADAIAEGGRFDGEILYRYQLQVEDAELISRAGQVVFVDAWQNGDTPFQWAPCEGKPQPTYTSHRLEPPAVVHLCNELFDAAPNAYCLLIKGEQWQLGDGLSAHALQNLAQALDFFNKFVGGLIDIESMTL
ncbi:MAG: hydrogenase maturation protease [Saprospiraceae bacterium]|nr:hydrogenase maturation protease [Saprospiraceae bacterium]